MVTKYIFVVLKDIYTTNIFEHVDIPKIHIPVENKCRLPLVLGFLCAERCIADRVFMMLGQFIGVG